ncbi:MAG: arsenate reductase family protein [Oscillospiraceae bacterium]|nr:arsenate reductase family protein [Oscillospiraceae bacterium]
MLFIEYPRCTTCKRAKQWLLDHQIPFEDRNITLQNPTEQELRDWQARSGLPLRRFFNTSGKLYQSMNLKEKLPTMTDEEQFALLASNGMIVKRPIVVTEDCVLVGFRPAEWEQALL